MTAKEKIGKLRRKKEIASNVMLYLNPGAILLLAMLFNLTDNLTGEYLIPGLIGLFLIMLIPVFFFVHYAKAYNAARENEFNAIIDGIKNSPVTFEQNG